jgi:hypothetical protein
MALTVSGLADEMEKAMGVEWQNSKGTTLPEAGKDDRRMLFLSISRGFLNSLLAQQNTLVDGVTLNDGVMSSQAYTVDSLTLNITIDE